MVAVNWPSGTRDASAADMTTRSGESEGRGQQEGARRNGTPLELVYALYTACGEEVSKTDKVEMER